MDLDLIAFVERRVNGSSAESDPGAHVGVFKKWIEMGDIPFV